jgi:hypothetical protein
MWAFDGMCSMYQNWVEKPPPVARYFTLYQKLCRKTPKQTPN